MHSGQQKFLGFFLDNTLPEKQDEAKKLLMQSFADQQSRKMTLADFNELQAKVLPLVKPEKLEEVKGAMAHFSRNLS
ncbi:hypothetical protein [Enterococcus termitis]|uniref:Uncharacterized protein n=1 Tax=Enterococcus termitis TaxID=332950 RepID=A0A1E5H5K7_9ENTE|nr:hypothetical protein [Enterococcus termitis]OEG19940.1 hypothetical protein BCR25_14195 [Enterococcus termitis]OJG97726.1 hypothetical protein RV18_GL000543 [Enterococcus termitis]